MKEKLYLYKLTQTVNGGYDTFDSAVVCSWSHTEARKIIVGSHGTWAAPEEVTVTPLGIALDGLTEGQIICSSFNAG